MSYRLDGTLHRYRILILVMDMPVLVWAVTSHIPVLHFKAIRMDAVIDPHMSTGTSTDVTSTHTTWCMSICDGFITSE